MIAEIQPSFASHTALSRKVEYHMGKIDEGNARVLYTSTGSDLASFPGDMRLVSQLNDRVKLPYSEITLSLYPGENLTDEQWLSLSHEYLREMGYEHACYAVILNSDKAHSHVHILTTTIDEDGKRISSSNNYARSEKISRALEESYGLRPLDPAYGRRTSLGENQYRQYYLNEALQKALRSYSHKDQLREWLQSSEAVAKLGKPWQSLRLTNAEWQQLLGEEAYRTLFDRLDKGGFFKTLYKDELLSKLDRLYDESDSTSMFRSKLEAEAIYMRLVTQKDKSYYVYGIKDAGFYLKDTSLPLRYRFGELSFDRNGMSFDEQKHYLYDHVFLSLNKAASYEEFKTALEADGIRLQEHRNAKGIYGLSYYIDGLEDPHIFKASDISRKLTYKAIHEHFQGQTKTDFEKFGRVGEFQERVEREEAYIEGRSSYIPLPDLTGGGKRTKDEDELDIPRKRKKKPNKNIDFTI